MTQSSDLLEKILQDIQSHGRKALVVFDLDSTLFDVSPRTQKILSDFTEDPQNRRLFPQSVEAMKTLKVRSQDWGVKQALIRHGLHTHPVDFHQAVRQYWIDRFFSGDYLKHDRPLPGAVDFVKAVVATGARVVYLTGRDQATMLQASRMVLETHGFPPAELVLKPQKGSDDALFKVNWFSEQNPKDYATVYFFENEPVNIHHVSERHPEVKIVFVDSTHSGKAEVSKDWPCLVNFSRALQKDSASE